MATFAPLVGKLVHLAHIGDVAIRCSASDDDGIRFVAAVESNANVRRLGGGGEHDVQTFERLVPEVEVGELPAPLPAVQATRLGGGENRDGPRSVSRCTTASPTGGRFVEARAAACEGGTRCLSRRLRPSITGSLPRGVELGSSPVASSESTRRACLTGR